MEQQTAGQYAAAESAGEAPQGAPDHSELGEDVSTIQTKLDQVVEKIKGDEALDATERHHRIREVWDRASNAHAELMKIYERQLEEDSAEKERGLFYVIPSNQDSTRSAYNDVYDRTEPAWSSGEMEGIEHAREEMWRLWERALRTGDRALQAAIGHLATERGMAELRDAWLATSEEKTRAWGRCVEARRKLADFQDPHRRFLNTVTGSFSLRKPPEA